ncbi:phage tail tape measure protein [Rhodovulum sp. BSW8]|uniref:Phage tail tape measure protein n=1 Tax=Rhodovulum visakhapatnamense TaxID=364297 RepID=A0ABS1RB76_9RHOB|nr:MULTISPECIES: phage tail tape measure protein [Rhodovulum]MBL3569383.1 phage tail tape measure protein [Rhodovulum visakhapatnamense]MBL3576740.1 phage tail tape measure protein [Rhodovulum visakhapatnamense]OLS44303.1 phage tail protein [Rhodovulum sulfidophilum]RBO54372.1 phage tail tape measure protein [Rhodovulum sp. BSW8]
MAEAEDIESFEAQLEALETTLGGASGTAAAFEVELVRMRDSLTLTNREVSSLSNAIGRGLRGAFDGLVFDGMKLSDALKSVANSVANATYAAAVKPVQNQLGGLLAGGIEGLLGAALPFARGAPFSQGRVIPFASGGIVGQATYFPMRGATGLMGEAGPEAILPLSRGADGRLGVRSDGSGSSRPIQIVMNISTPDVQGFARSQSQIAAEMSRLLSRGQRNR